MIVRLVARPQFVAVPSELGAPRPDQLQGPDAGKLIELAGRCCYDSLGTGRDSAAYARHILESGHGSVLEHAQYSFFVSGVSRGLTHELVRHRVGVAISQRSTRYVDESEGKWVPHPLLARLLDQDPGLHSAWLGLIGDARDIYNQITDRGQSLLAAQGVDKLTARKQARGAARGVLGNALETELIWSANVRALRHVISMRASPAADAEIRGLGIWLLRIMRDELPAFFGDFTVVPSDDGFGEVATAAYPKV